MSEWVSVEGQIRNLAGVVGPGKFVVEMLAPIPREIVVDYLRHYLDAGTQEECEVHPALDASENRARAVLTYRYLRDRREALSHARADWLPAAPLELGALLFSDDLVRVWSPPRT